jgi:hypothetical protein
VKKSNVLREFLTELALNVNQKLSNYNMNQINNLKEKIQQLISQATEKNNHQKNLLNFLFSKLNEVKELETLQSLREYENGKYLKAYLLYKSISRANYQPEHLKLTQLDNIDKCLEMIKKDIEANQPKEEKLNWEELTNQQLLTILGERIAQGEIKRDKVNNIDWLFVDTNPNEPEPLRIDLDTGKIEPDPAEEFFKKHGIKK